MSIITIFAAQSRETASAHSKSFLLSLNVSRRGSRLAAGASSRSGTHTL